MEKMLWTPREQVISNLSGQYLPEMNAFESAYLCGIIATKKPKKILEVGVAAGGTTAIMLQCIKNEGLENECEIVSVDLNERYYRDSTKITGFLANDYKNNDDDTFEHEFVLGDWLPRVIEKIGEGIDLVVLDTVHYFPGEILDFPVLLPFLSDGAIVILHDVAYHQYQYIDGTATQLLLDSLVGEVDFPINKDTSNKSGMPNIASVTVNSDTKKYIESVFRAMTLPWTYYPTDDELKVYRDFYEKYYEARCVQLFELAIEVNKKRSEWQQPQKRSAIERVIGAAKLIIKGYL